MKKIDHEYLGNSKSTSHKTLNEILKGQTLLSISLFF